MTATRNYSVRTDWGRFGVSFRGGRVCGLVFPNGRLRAPQLDGREAGPGRELAEQLRAYLAGQRVRFRVAVDLSDGTPFQQAVWRAMARIPYGRVRTYAQLAADVCRPGAARAVGGAAGSNPLPLIIPCHRVVATGGLGGFSARGGVALKRRLLELEGAQLV